MLQVIPIDSILNVKLEPNSPEIIPKASSFQTAVTGNEYIRHATPSPQRVQLPPEIWLIIFRTATLVPGATEVDDHDAIAAYASDEYGISVSVRYQETMQTKLSLIRVSKSWRILMTRFLYEYIVIRNGKQASRLKDTLTCNASRHDWQSYGFRTARIDLTLEDVHVWEESYTNAVSSVLHHCPNLVTFSTAFCNAEAYLFYPDTFAEALAPLRHLKGLRRLELRGEVKFLNTVLGNVAQHLEVLWLLPSPKGAGPCESVPFCFPKLHTLKIDFLLSRFTEHWDMPALKNYSSVDVARIPSCLQTSGRRLRYLSMPGVPSIIPALALCPDLSDLRLNGAVLVPTAQCPTHSNITRVTIEGCRDLSRPISWYNESNSAAMEHLRISLNTVIDEKTFPVLESIRFVLPLNWVPYDGEPPSCFSSIWDPWLDACIFRGVHVDVSVGAVDHTANKWRPFSSEFFLRTI